MNIKRYKIIELFGEDNFYHYESFKKKTDDAEILSHFFDLELVSDNFAIMRWVTSIYERAYNTLPKIRISNCLDKKIKRQTIKTKKYIEVESNRLNGDKELTNTVK